MVKKAQEKGGIQTREGKPLTLGLEGEGKTEDVGCTVISDKKRVGKR